MTQVPCKSCGTFNDQQLCDNCARKIIDQYKAYQVRGSKTTPILPGAMRTACTVPGCIRCGAEEKMMETIPVGALPRRIENGKVITGYGCTREICPDIFKGHSEGCRYYKV
jgi:hypothetical protein